MNTLWRAYNCVKVGVAIILQIIGGCPIAVPPPPTSIVIVKQQEKPKDRIMDEAHGVMRRRFETFFLTYARMIEDFQQVFQGLLPSPSITTWIMPSDNGWQLHMADGPPIVSGIDLCL